MQTFVDTAGRTWAVSVDVATVKRVRSLVDVDLLDLEKSMPAIADPVTLCDVLYAIVQPQAEKAGVTDEQFGAAMGGDTLDAASNALLESLTLFFSGPRRETLRKVLEKTKRAERLAAEAVDRRLEMMTDSAISEQMERELTSREQRLGLSSTSGPGYSD